MLALLCAGVTRSYFWLHSSYVNKKFQDLSTFYDPFVLLLLVLWVVRGVSIYNTKNLQSSLLLYGFFTTVVVFVVFFIKYLKNNPEQILKILSSE